MRTAREVVEGCKMKSRVERPIEVNGVTWQGSPCCQLCGSLTIL